MPAAKSGVGLRRVLLLDHIVVRPAGSLMGPPPILQLPAAVHVSAAQIRRPSIRQVSADDPHPPGAAGEGEVAHACPDELRRGVVLAGLTP
jgi:hypothetical protein